MINNDKTINFSIPEQVLKKLKGESIQTGVPVSHLIKIAISKIYGENKNETE